MKKRIFMLAVLILSGLQFAVAAIDEQLRALITTSDDIEVTEVTNDEANPWTVADGMASSTVGKLRQYVFSSITIKFTTKKPIIMRYDFTFDPYSNNDYRRVYTDGVTQVDSYTAYKTKATSTFYFGMGEHVFTYTHYHSYSVSDSYTQVLTIGNIRFESVESQYMTINLSAPGTLGVEALSHVNTLPEMRYLRLSGKMNASDWNDISKMTGLTAIDMTNVDIETIPASAFTNTWIHFIDFPTKLKTIGDNAFDNRLLTGPLVLPEGLDSIGKEAFQKNYITEVTIPESVRGIGQAAFFDNQYLQSATLNNNMETIVRSLFNNCKKLAVVHGGKNVKNIFYRAFWGCDSLRSIKDVVPVTIDREAFYNCKKLDSINFSRIKSIGYESFYQCYGLKEADLTTLTSIDRSFAGCTGIKKVTLGNDITTIKSDAFYNCHALEEVILGSSINSLESNCFYSDKNALKRVYITAPAPPAVGTSPFYSPTSVTLYVPEYAMVSYKLDDYWSKFTKVEPNPNTPDKVNLYKKKLELTSNARIPNSTDMYLGYGSSLIVNGNNPQAFGSYKQRMDKDDSWTSSLISRCNAMTSAASTIEYYFDETSSGYGCWHYVCMPFDVKRSEIIPLNEGRAIAVRYYDSESRATNGASGNWKDVPADSVLHMGKGYIFRINNSGYVELPATEETHNAIFRSEAVTTPLVQYAAVESANAGWNFVGNPYPCYYDIYHMDFAAPITVWNINNRTYNAYSAADDEFVLMPSQAFFVQKPELVETITFQPAGRQINKTIDHSALAKRRAASNKQVQRKLVDVSLTCADRTDRTRVVVNANASDDFCADNDAVKMMAYEGTPQIYTIAGADQLAVNEGAHRGGSVALGMYLPADDTYTIAIDRDELGAKLLDYGVEVEMPYTFSAAEGYADDRFTLTFETSTTGINSIATDADADNAIYTIDGRRVNSTAQKGIYIQNHKKIVK
ncbi:leucine-rich repeat domain-containing protein [Leyella stercorea]|uniref:leucine-rich repeat domain-containing protein n=1 Tax=Leyella stercorea TaxID=363265 RepID=UPI00242BA4CA|nr:leucine-rich repeat domain-containing protein [Leyella stercorea]